MFDNLFSTTPTATKTSPNQFSGLFAQQAGTKSSVVSNRQTFQPRGEPSKFQAPAGGTQIGPNKWKTPSGSTWEYTPDGMRVVHLAAQFGGGSYTVNPQKPGEVVKTERDYAGVPSQVGQQRDHIVPVSLGGISTAKTNIRGVPNQMNEAKFEADIASKVKSGEMTLAQGRLAVMTRKQEQHMNVPTQSVGRNFLDTITEKYEYPLETIKEIALDPGAKKGNLKKGLQDMWEAVKQPVEMQANLIKELMDKPAGTPAERISDTARFGVGMVNMAFAPITAIFEGSKQIPILGTVSRLLTLPLSFGQVAATDATDAIIDQLPVSQETKNQLKPGLKELGGLVGMFLGGAATGVGAKEFAKLEAKYGTRDATTLVNVARQEAFKIQQKELAKEQLKLKQEPVVENAIQMMDKENLKIFEQAPPQKPGTVRFYQSSLGEAGAKGSYLDTSLERQITRGTAKEPKYVFDIPEARVPSYAKLAAGERGKYGEYLTAREVKQYTVFDSTRPINPQLKSRVFERLQQERPEALKGDLRAEKVNLRSDMEKALDILVKDKQEAYEIAIGRKTSSDVTSTSVNIAMAEKALADGNTKLYSELVTKRSLEQTRRGQEIVAEKGSVKDNSTARYVKELIANRIENLSKDFLSNLKDPFGRKSSKEKAMQKIDNEVSKLESKIKSKKLDTKTALDLLEKLTCV